MTDTPYKPLHPSAARSPFCRALPRFCKGIGSLIINSSAESVWAGPTQVLCNRDGGAKYKLPEDGFYQLAPLGEYLNNHKRPDGKVETIMQVYDEAGFREMVRRHQSGELLINYEHHAYDPEQPRGSAAAGWIEELQVRADGLYGRIRWTSGGQADVEGGAYRYLSPEHPRSDVQHLGGNRYRITGLAGAALTNKHNLKGLKPLSNRNNNHNIDMDKLLERIRKFLGLGTDADENAILAAMPAENITLASLQKPTGDAPAPSADEEKLTNRIKALTAQLAERDLEAYADVIEPGQEDVLKQQLITNRDNTVKLLGVLRRVASQERPGGVIHNRQTAVAPNTQDKLDKAEAEDAVTANKISRRADEILKNKEVTSPVTAWRQAREEILGAGA